MLTNFKKILKEFNTVSKEMIDKPEYAFSIEKARDAIRDALPTIPILIVEEQEYYAALRGCEVREDDSSITLVTTDLLLKSQAEQCKNEMATALKTVTKAYEHDIKGLPFETFILISQETDGELIGNLYHEVSPEHWFVLNIEYRFLNGSKHICINGEIQHIDYYPIVLTADYLFNSKTKIEIEPTSINIGQIVSGMPRHQRHEAKHLVYGTKKQYLKQYTTQQDRILKASKLAHLVRGHWRRLINGQRIGKDRHNEPIMNGYTWVIPHKRGQGEIEHNTIYVK